MHPNIFERVVVAVGYCLGGAFLLFMFFLLVAYLPVALYTQAECLRNGYPKYAVSIGLERYCMNLEGTVTVRVDKADGNR